MATEEQLKHLSSFLSAAEAPKRKIRSLLKISDFSAEEVEEILAGGLKTKRDPAAFATALDSVRIALLFQKTSTRTRCSFEVGVCEMGGHPIYLDWSRSNFALADLRDEIHVLSRYFDLIMARVHKHTDLETMRAYSEKPIINGLSDEHHPCQGLTDAMTMLEYFGSLRGLHLVYVGDGNNVLHSLLEVAALTGIEITASSPEGYDADRIVTKFATNRTKVNFVRNPAEAVRNADVIYTDTWISMGDEAETEVRLKTFADYQVNEALVAKAPKHAIIMHDLPAHRGQEISSGVIESDRCIIFDQAENRKHLQKFLMQYLLRR